MFSAIAAWLPEAAKRHPSRASFRMARTHTVHRKSGGVKLKRTLFSARMPKQNFGTNGGVFGRWPQKAGMRERHPAANANAL